MDQPFLLSEKTFCSVIFFPAKIFFDPEIALNFETLAEKNLSK
jgi:hypothetical protein